MAKKNGRKKTGEKKSGKIIPEKYHGNFLLENLPQNIFENIDQENNDRENEGDKKPGISPADYIAIFRKAEIMSRNKGPVLQWRYIGELVETHLQMQGSERQETGRAQEHNLPRSLPRSTATQAGQATSHPGHRQTRQHRHQATQERSHTARTAHAAGKAAQCQGKATGKAAGRAQRHGRAGAKRH